MRGLSAPPSSLAIQLEENSRLFLSGRKDNLESNLCPLWLPPAEAIVVVMVVMIKLGPDDNTVCLPYSRWWTPRWRTVIVLRPPKGGKSLSIVAEADPLP